MTTTTGFVIRPASRGDGPAILRLERELSAFEQLEGPGEAEGKRLLSWIFDEGRFHARVAEREGMVVAVALYFFFPSSFRARPGLYLEDLIVTREARSSGAGELLMRELAAVAVKLKCIRMDWSVLPWNEEAIRFYKRLGGRPQTEWDRYFLDEDALGRLANSGDDSHHG